MLDMITIIKNSQLKLLVVAPDAALFRKSKGEGFLRQNLQLFDLNISENDWKFALPELDNDKKPQKSSLELGQVSRGNKTLEIVHFSKLSPIRATNNERVRVSFSSSCICLVAC